MRPAAVLLALVLGILALPATPLRAAPVDINVPAQPADRALLAFSKQANIAVLFSYEDLRRVRSHEVVGRFEPEDALKELLRNTGFVAQRSGEAKFVVKRAAPQTGTVRGRLVGMDGTGVRGAQVAIAHTRQATVTNEKGDYVLTEVPAGVYRLFATADGYQPVQIVDVDVTSGHELALGARTMRPANEPGRLDPFVVEGKSARPWRMDQSETEMLPRTASGNLDLARTENDALPYTIYNREQIARSGVTNLNEFLQRELLDGDTKSLPPEQSTSSDITSLVGSTNLKLRGYDPDSTIVLVNGRRMPEMLTNMLPNDGSTTLPPDVNFVPLSLVQQIQVLPTSAAALYTGNAVGGVINIVLRPDVDATATEVSATYTNALAGYDAPQSSVSLLHARSLLNGKLRVRFNVNVAQAMPPTESELGYHRAHQIPPATPDPRIHRATPNIQSADGSPLFGPGSPSVTSVAPGADGSGGLAAFTGRAGVRNFDFFDSPGDLASSTDALDYPYGRRQRRVAYYGSAVSDIFPWLQLGSDVTFARTVVNRGYDVAAADLQLDASSPQNPFKRDVIVSLNETMPQLGEKYNEARLDFASVVVGALIKLPAEWRVSLDAQYAHNIVKYRGLAGTDMERWQNLVDTGRYNPLRDTQVFGPPAEFYDRVLIYRGGRNHFVTLGNYDTLDLAARATNQALKLPTGPATFNGGVDYRRNHLNRYVDELRYGDGTLATEPSEWSSRTLGRYSVFGELQAPLLPASWLPKSIRKLEADVAVRYVASASSTESNIAPTFALKSEFANGLIARGSVTTSNRLPTPQMSRQVVAPPTGGGTINLTRLFDPARNETYGVQVIEDLSPSLRPEEAVTQTAGLVYQRGKVHRFRTAVDFVDTRKVNELVFLSGKDVLNLEPIFPERVTRAALLPGDPHAVGPALTVLIGTINLSRRHSQNWNFSFDYAWTRCFGGTLEAYGRVLYFQRYDVTTAPNTPVVDQLNRPNGAAGGLLRFRSNFGTGWFNRDYGFGIDGHYFDNRVLPVEERAGQGHRSLSDFWQFDTYLQTNIGRWLPWKDSRRALRAQFRVNNVFNADFPRYVNGPSDSGVQPYGDWRGRYYSVSVTAAF